MSVSPEISEVLHRKLPIDADENIVAVYRHHWFAYAIIWIKAGLIVIIFMTIALVLTNMGDAFFSDNRSRVLAVAGIMSMLVLLGAYVPVSLRKKEQMVLTNEALLQVLQPTPFASKVDQVSLMRVDDVSARRGFLGTVLGFGHITVETPGEQDNYEFRRLPDPEIASREITNAREKYEVAIESGQLRPKSGPVKQSVAAPANGSTIDPAEYQKFQEFEKWQANQQDTNGADDNPRNSG